MILGLVEAIGALLAVYVLTNLLFRSLGLLSYSHGSRRDPRIAITIDDGPSPMTPQILEILRKYRVKATFFVCGNRAKLFPKHLEAIKKDGHQIESHGFQHKILFLFSLFHEWRNIKLMPGCHYRPPYGLHSPFTRLFTWILGKKVVLWDLESKDWLDFSLEFLAQRLLYYLRPGSIVLFHDGPSVTPKLLEHVLPDILKLGYQPVVLNELELRRLGFRLSVIRGMQWFNERYNKWFAIQRIGYGPFDLFRVAKKLYKGPPLPEVPSGTVVYELHLESDRVMEFTPTETLSYFKESVQKLAFFVEKDKEIQAIYGRGYLAAWLKHLGFKIYKGPFPFFQWFIDAATGIWFLWLYRGRLPKKGRPLVTLAYITREEFLRLYLPRVTF